MLRFIYMIFLTCLSMVVIGQSVEIQKSTDIIVIKGKSYYLHTVLPSQTLYSICKAYGLSLEEVKTMNDKKDNSLSPYDVLKLPYQDTFIQQDEKYYYHKAVKGETLYSIARHYDIKPKKLLKQNKEYDDTPLSIGSVVRLPLDEIDLSVLHIETQITNVVVPVAKAVPDVKPEEPKKEKIDRVLVSQVGIAENTDTTAYISEVIMPSNSFVRIALLLPLSAGEYPMLVDTLQIDTLLIDSLKSTTVQVDVIKISSRSEMFISFYEGILFAVDSLKKQGCKVELHVFDTERNSEKMYLLADEINRLNPDLIIGPIYGSTYKVLIDQLRNKNIPMIYPLSRSDNLGKYPNIIQVNSSFEVLADQMFHWIESQRDTANIINLNILNIDYADQYEKQAFRDSLKQMEGVCSFDWNLEDTPLDSLRMLFLPGRENIIVLPLGEEADVSKILVPLSALTCDYQITVLGLPEWQSFESVDHEAYYKLNTKIFTHNYVDYSKKATKAIVDKFRKYYYTEPNALTIKAYDMGLYFIELAAKYRHQTLAALESYERSTDFSTFRFRKMKNGLGKENHGFHIINFGTDFLLKIEGVEK